MARKRIGEVLLERGMITPPQLDLALGHQRSGSGRIGATLVALGALSEGQLTTALGEMHGIEVIDLGREAPEWDVIHLLRPEFCERHLVLPLSLIEERGRRTLRLAMADALDFPTIDAIEYAVNCKVQPVLAGASQIRAAIARWLHGVSPTSGEAVEAMRFLPADEVVADEEVLPLEEEVSSRSAGDDSGFPFAATRSGDRLSRLERRVEALEALLEARGLCTREELRRLLDGPASGNA